MIPETPTRLHLTVPPEAEGTRLDVFVAGHTQLTRSRAQKLIRVKFRRLPRYVRAMEIALLPLMKPTTWDTAYFGGILINMCTWSGSK